MIEAATKARGKHADEILSAMFAACDKFTAEAPQHDDMTMLILKLDKLD
jgi:phosphoserine phosphatase RsbU/P